MQFIRLFDAEKKILLDFLGYGVNKDGIVVSKDNKMLICPYTGEPIRFKDASVMPGSTVIFNTSPFTLAEYFSKHVECGDNNDRCRK